jgi:transposase-like protein
MTLADHLFKRRRFDRLVMVLNVRWLVSYKLSYLDLVKMMADRGLIAITPISYFRRFGQNPYRERTLSFL